MLNQQDNETLTRVGPGTPMGNLMRRYWIPAALSFELPEPDCPPIEVRLLGENLVAFRATDGRVGLLDIYCPHRRVSLWYGRNEEDGLRCVYHGWKFDVSGACVDMPSEPETSNFKDKVVVTSYPTVEVGGVVWCYMGPPDKRPADPLFEWTQAPETHRGLTKVLQESNWLQGLEGGIDSVHSNFLHRGQPRDASQQRINGATRMRALGFSAAADIRVHPTDYGYTYAGLRALPDGSKFVRGYHWVMPWNQLRGYSVDTEKPTVHGHIWVPVDDYQTMVYNWTYTYGEQPLGDEERRLAGTGNEFGTDIDMQTFRSHRSRENRYKIDREMQRTQNFSGIVGTNTQDRAVQESMGTIADRSLERLGTTDRAIITSRQMLLAAVKTVAAGGDPPGVAPTYYKLRAVEHVLTAGDDWFEEMQPGLFQIEPPLPVAGG